MIMEVIDIPSDSVIDQSTRKSVFFDSETDEPIMVENSRGRVRVPNGKPLKQVLRG
jgi:hypothetical protein